MIYTARGMFFMLDGTEAPVHQLSHAAFITLVEGPKQSILIIMILHLVPEPLIGEVDMDHHLRVHIGIEPVFVGRGNVPGVPRLVLDEFDLDDRLDALEPVLPRHYQP